MVDFPNNERKSVVQNKNWAIWVALGTHFFLRKRNGLWHNDKEMMSLQDDEDEETANVQNRKNKRNVMLMMMMMTKRKTRKFFCYVYKGKTMTHVKGIRRCC